jgi:excisionase family DNA binding protein
MDKIIFSAIEITELQALIASTVEKVFHKINQGITDKPADTDRWMNLDELCQYHPDKPSKQTCYGWVHAGLIPFHKGGKRLRFLKSDIDSWLLQGRKKTTAEVDAQLSAERDTYLLTKKKGGKL